MCVTCNWSYQNQRKAVWKVQVKLLIYGNPFKHRFPHVSPREKKKTKPKKKNKNKNKQKKKTTERTRVYGQFKTSALVSSINDNDFFDANQTWCNQIAQHIASEPCKKVL